MISETGPKTYQELKTKFALLNFILFRYLQMLHALHAQFPESFHQLPSLPILDAILGSDPKKLISIFYNDLLTPLATVLTYRLKTRWSRDAGEMEDENRAEILEG